MAAEPGHAPPALRLGAQPGPDGPSVILEKPGLPAPGTYAPEHTSRTTRVVRPHTGRVRSRFRAYQKSREATYSLELDTQAPVYALEHTGFSGSLMSPYGVHRAAQRTPGPSGPHQQHAVSGVSKPLPQEVRTTLCPAHRFRKADCQHSELEPERRLSEKWYLVAFNFTVSAEFVMPSLQWGAPSPKPRLIRADQPPIPAENLRTLTRSNRPFV